MASYALTIELLNQMYGEEKEGADEAPLFKCTSELQQRIEVVYDRVDGFRRAEPDVGKAAKKVEINKVLEAREQFYARVDPKVEPEMGLIQKLYEEIVAPFYVNTTTNDGYYRDYLSDEDKNEEEQLEDSYENVQVFNYTRNEPLPKDRRRPVIVNRADVPVNFMGIPKESKGTTKREKSYWIGKVYNENHRGRRNDSNLANTIAAYFGIHRATLFRNAAYAEAFDKTHELTAQSTVVESASKIADGIRGDWVLRNVDFKVWVKPWESPDDYTMRKGTVTRSNEAKESALRQI